MQRATTAQTVRPTVKQAKVSVSLLWLADPQSLYVCRLRAGQKHQCSLVTL
jgi:hypothetical protein